MRQTLRLLLFCLQSAAAVDLAAQISRQAEPGYLDLTNGQTLQLGEYSVAGSFIAENARAPRTSERQAAYRTSILRVAVAYGLTGTTDLFFELPHLRGYSSDKNWAGFLGDQEHHGAFDLDGVGKLRTGVTHRMFGGPHDILTGSFSFYQDINFGGAEVERLTGNNSRGMEVAVSLCKWLANFGYRDAGGNPSTNEFRVAFGWSNRHDERPAFTGEVEYVRTSSHRYVAPDELKIIGGMRAPVFRRASVTVGVSARIDELHTGRSPLGFEFVIGRRSRL